MSIEKIEKELPNGLHDAVMRKHVVDYENSTVTFYVDVWVGDLNSTIEEEREKYKSGILEFKQVEYFVIEPPSEVNAIFEPFAFDVGNPEIDKIKPYVNLPETPKNTFRTFFFIYKLNAFMHICSSKIEFSFNKDT